jgi:hypothetical protein
MGAAKVVGDPCQRWGGRQLFFPAEALIDRRILMLGWWITLSTLSKNAVHRRRTMRRACQVQ